MVVWALVSDVLAKRGQQLFFCCLSMHVHLRHNNHTHSLVSGWNAFVQPQLDGLPGQVEQLDLCRAEQRKETSLKRYPGFERNVYVLTHFSTRTRIYTLRTGGRKPTARERERECRANEEGASGTQKHS